MDKGREIWWRWATALSDGEGDVDFSEGLNQILKKDTFLLVTLGGTFFLS